MHAPLATIRKVEPADADNLLSLSKDTFFEFFAHLNEPANMAAYTAVAFTPKRILAELKTPGSFFYFAIIDGVIAGYLKINFNSAQTEFKDPNAIEVERIYVSGQNHGKKIGKQLLHFALDIAANKGMRYVWLGVWEHNHKAITFYEHNGFKTFSSHDFMLGDDKQTDLLMKKEIG